MKLRKFGEEFETKFYDNDGTPHKDVPIEDLLVKGSQMTAIIECAGIWFAGSKYGLTWRAKQIAIPKSSSKISGFAFKGLKARPAAVTADVEVEDADEEADDDAEQEVDDAAAFRAPPKASVVAAVLPPKPSAVAAVTAVATTVDDEEGDDVEPAPAPKKTIIKKKIVTKAK